MTVFVNNGKKAADGAVPVYEIVDGGTGATTAGAALTNLGGLNAADHNGLDHTGSPLFLLTQALHATTSHAGVAGLDAKSILVMTGNEIVNDNSAPIQFLDPNGVARVVTLPPLALTNPAFVFVNFGFYLIRIVDSTGRYVIDVVPGQAVRVLSDGSAAWRIGFREDTATDLTGQIYSWGGTPGGNNFFRPWGQYDVGGAGSTVDNPGTYHVIQVAGVIDEMAYNMSGEGATERVDIFVNGVIERQVRTTGGGIAPTGGGVAIFDPITVAAGDRVAARTQSGVAAMMIQVRVRNSTDGYLVPYGGDIATNDAYYGLADNSNNNKTITTANPDHTFICWAPGGGGNLTSVAYAIDGADVADQIDVFVGGVLNQTVTLTNGSVVNGVLVGIETLTGSFLNGDALTVRGKDAANMDDAVLTIMTDVGGHLYIYKGNPGNDGFWEVWMDDANDGGNNNGNARTKAIVRRRGRAVLTWSATSAPTEAWQVHRKRGVQTDNNTVNTVGMATGTAVLPLTYEPGDLVQVQSGDGAEGQTSLGILIQ